MTRQKILITGASSGLGAGMARQFAAKGRDLALCARRLDNLEELKAELTAQYPGVTVAIAALDVNDHDQVPKVFDELSDQLGGIDCVIVNAGKAWRFGVEYIQTTTTYGNAADFDASQLAVSSMLRF